MPALDDIRACAFDAYGTLFDVHAAAAKKRDAIGDKADALSAHWRSRQLHYTWLRALMGKHVDFWQVTSDALDFAMEAVEIDDAALRDELLALYRTLDVYPDVAPTLERLRAAGIRTAILSNGEPSMLEDAARHAGILDLLDDVLSVESVGVFKPDPRVYQYAADQLGAEPRQVAFMTANAWDAHGAASFGLSVVWVNRFGQPAEKLPGTPAATLGSLTELPPILGA